MFNWLRKKLGWRWSIYVLRDRKELGFAMHSHNVGDLLGYIGGWFDRRGDPPGRYSFALNFNINHTVIHLSGGDFSAGGNPTDALWERVLSADPEAPKQRHLGLGQFEWLNAATRKSIDSSTVQQVVYGGQEA
jgi:hypothetical protein